MIIKARLYERVGRLVKENKGYVITIVKDIKYKTDIRKDKLVVYELVKTLNKHTYMEWKDENISR